jgi:hypothetical protein
MMNARHRYLLLAGDVGSYIDHSEEASPIWCMPLRYPEGRVGEDLADEVGLTTVAGLGKNLF